MKTAPTNRLAYRSADRIRSALTAGAPSTRPAAALRAVRDALREIRSIAAKDNQAGARTRVARQLNAAAGILAISVLADSAIEHYRGSFRNRAMYLPLIASVLSLLSSAHGAADSTVRQRRVRHLLYGAAATTGVIGTGFHIYNILKRESGLSWLNLFYAAPIGAPAALSLSGLYGLAAEGVRNASPARRRMLRRPAGRALAGFTAAALAGTVAEVGLLHFRGAFQNPFMYAPVTLPPVASALMANAALRPSPAPHRLTRIGLLATGVLGLLGVGFHAYGISRAMGGWRNKQQNVVDGPPLPAPPSFSALALAGLAALSLMEGRSDG
jgi:hypothetical protein